MSWVRQTSVVVVLNFGEFIRIIEMCKKINIRQMQGRNQERVKGAEAPP